jgi:AcrR family transcriptional regulator
MASRREPLQARSRQRREKILATTSELLEKVGFDDLTTILIARETGISVGSLYHYFPNKQAILHAMGERWLEEFTHALDDLSTLPLEGMALDRFSNSLVDRLLTVYREQRGLLPLVQAMYAVPELRDLDERHDELAIARFAALLRRLGFTRRQPELERIARVWLEITHAAFVTVSEQSGRRAAASLADLKALTLALLERHGPG